MSKLEYCLYIDMPHIWPKIEIKTNSKDFSTYLLNVYSPYVRPGLGSGIKETTGWDCLCLSIWFQGESILVMDEKGQRGVQLTDNNFLKGINDILLRSFYPEKGYAYLHGAAFEWNGRAICLLGKSGMGKTTLIAYLLAKGYRYITDDKIIIDVHKNEIMPFPRKLSLRSESVELLKREYNISLSGQEHLFLNYCRYLVSPIHKIYQPLQLSTFIFMNREMGCDSMDRLQNTEKYESLLKCCMTQTDMKANIIQTSGLCSQNAAFKMTYFDLNNVVDLVQGIL